MCVTPGCVHDEGTRVFANGFGEGFRAMLNDDIAPAYLAGKRGIERWTTARRVPVFELRDNNLCFEPRLALNEQIRGYTFARISWGKSLQFDL